MTTRAARPTAYERRCIAAIENYQQAKERFLPLAEQSADVGVDTDEWRAFLAAEDALHEAERALWPFVKEGRRPPLYHGVVYLPGFKEGQVRDVQVHDLEGGGQSP